MLGSNVSIATENLHRREPGESVRRDLPLNFFMGPLPGAL